MGSLSEAWRSVRPTTGPEAEGEPTDAELEAKVRAAQSCGLRVDGPALVRALAAIEGPLPDDERTIELALALGCIDGDAAALERFESEILARVPRSVAHLRLDAADHRELVQEVRTRLLVAPAGERPKIAEYAGRGRMHGLVKVIAVRAALDLLERKKKHAPGDAGADRAVAPDRDPELAYLDARYRAVFAEAFEEAAKTLERRERNWLRMHVLAGAGLEDIAKMYGVHRATVVRSIGKARQHLLDETRKGMRKKLGIDLRELDSIMRLVGSRLDASVARVLASTGDHRSGSV